MGEPETYRGAFDLLERHGWIERSLAEKLRAMAGLRNILVHGYEIVDLAIVRELAENHLDDLRALAAGPA